MDGSSASSDEGLPPPPYISDSAPSETKALWWLHGHPHSSRFANRSLDSLAALLDHNAVAYADQVAFMYPTSSGPTPPEYAPITWAEFGRHTTALARRYVERSAALRDLISSGNAARRQPTVALWAAGHTVEYFMSQMALAKLGVRTLLLADSAAANAVEHLVRVTGARVVVADAKRRARAGDAAGMEVVEMVEEWDFSSSESSMEGGEGEGYREVAFDDGKDPWDRHAFIIHSSGSTGLPKPITHTNRSLMQIARMYRLFPEFHIENWLLLFPLFHIAGFSIILSGLPNGLTSTFPPRQWPPVSSSILHVCSSLEALGRPVECIHTAPMVIENLVSYIESSSSCPPSSAATEQPDFTPLAKLKVLQPGGAMLSASVVDKLVSRGVNVKTTYGSTEIGPPLRSVPHSRDNPHCYRLANLYRDNPHLKMEEVSKGVYELVVRRGFLLAAELWGVKGDGSGEKEGEDNDDVYRTRDLFVEEPEGSGMYRLTGRRDDMLVHTSGENTNAQPIELDIRSRTQGVVRAAVVLGHARPCTGLLVELEEEQHRQEKEEEGKGTREEEDPRPLEKLWSALDHVNALYPPHSTVLRSMVHVLPPGRHLPVTPKGSVKRAEAERLFAAEIEDLYAQMDGGGGGVNSSSSSSGDKEGQHLLRGEELKTAIRGAVASVLGPSSSSFSSEQTMVDDTTSLYDVGMDSIRAIQLRGALSRAVGPVTLGAVFECASVGKLAAMYEGRAAAASVSASGAVASSASPDAVENLGGDDAAARKKTARVQSIRETIARYVERVKSWDAEETAVQAASLPPRGSEGSGGREKVLLTGASGSLGTALIEKLVGSPRVDKVYALCSGDDPRGKLEKSMRSRGMKVDLNEKVEVLSYSMSAPLLGLRGGQAEYDRLAGEVTTVVHGAWMMDFNRGVDEFERRCLESVVQLMRFCKTGEVKTFAFISSIAASMGEASGGLIPEEVAPENPLTALGTGYAQSKFIVERIMSEVADSVQIPMKIFRLGQMYGHTQTGSWNFDEMFPIMLATSLQLGALPTFSDGRMVDWIPVDDAAGAMHDVILAAPPASEEGGSRNSGLATHNIVNPSPITWDEYLDEVQAALCVIAAAAPGLAVASRASRIPMADWVARLSEASEADGGGKIPGARLLNFFEDMVPAAAEGSAGPASQAPPLVFDTQRTKVISPSLRACRPVNRNLIGACFDRWESKGLVHLGERPKMNGLEGKVSRQSEVGDEMTGEQLRWDMKTPLASHSVLEVV